MVSLAITVAVLVFREFFVPLTDEDWRQHRLLNLAILIVFAIDYFTRLLLAKDKKTFIKRHIPELIAIIPLDIIFQLARMVHLIRLVRLFRLFRALVIFRRFSGTFFGILRTNGLQYVILLTTGIALLGALGIQYLERDTGQIQSFGYALWWSVVTITTVGYGDIAPITTGGRILAGLMMIAGIGFLGMLTGTIATYFVDQVIKKKTTSSLNDEVKDLIKSKVDALESLDEQELERLIELIKFHRQNK